MAQAPGQTQNQPGEAAGKPVFTTGSTMRHVVVMTVTSSIGLVAIFVVDLLNLFYISLLGQQVLAAAVGYAATVIFFTVSVSIGLSIAATAMVSQALGAGDEATARCQATVCLTYVAATTSLVALVLYPNIPLALRALGAEGETLAIATHFMRITVPSSPLLGLGMAFGGLLRATGDARRAMYVTLVGGAVAAVLDPILIFALDLGITGAALTTIFTRVALVVVGWHGTHVVHRMLGPLSPAVARRTLWPFLLIAGPAVATQLATPVGNAYVTAAIATFGDDAVAGWAIVGRVLPVAFGTIFSLSGAIGAILGQNYGARLFDRVHQSLKDALLFAMIYVLATWAVLALASDLVVAAFDAQGDAAALVRFFCLVVAGSFLFNGALFVANAAFNNLGDALYATLFNWGRATLGVIPFVWVGKHFGAEGVLAGWGLGAVVFGILAVFFAFRLVARLPEKAAREDRAKKRPRVPPTAHSPFTSGKGAVG